MSINQAQSDQKDFSKALDNLEKNIKSRPKRDEVLRNAKKLLESRKKELNNFLNGTYPLSTPRTPRQPIVEPIIEDPDMTIVPDMPPLEGDDDDDDDYQSPLEEPLELAGRRKMMFFTQIYDFLSYLLWVALF